MESLNQGMVSSDLRISTHIRNSGPEYLHKGHFGKTTARPLFPRSRGNIRMEFLVGRMVDKTTETGMKYLLSLSNTAKTVLTPAKETRTFIHLISLELANVFCAELDSKSFRLYHHTVSVAYSSFYCFLFLFFHKALKM